MTAKPFCSPFCPFYAGVNDDEILGCFYNNHKRRDWMAGGDGQAAVPLLYSSLHNQPGARLTHERCPLCSKHDVLQSMMLQQALGGRNLNPAHESIPTRADILTTKNDSSSRILFVSQCAPSFSLHCCQLGWELRSS